MDILKLKQLLNLSWSYEPCSPGLKNKWNKDNACIGQCAITPIIVNDIFDGKIMRCMTSTGSHYYNLINDTIIDLTVEQFYYEIPKYEEGSKRTREYLLSNENIKERHFLLTNRLEREDSKICSIKKIIKYKKKRENYEDLY